MSVVRFMFDLWVLAGAVVSLYIGGPAVMSLVETGAVLPSLVGVAVGVLLLWLIVSKAGDLANGGVGS